MYLIYLKLVKRNSNLLSHKLSHLNFYESERNVHTIFKEDKNENSEEYTLHKFNEGTKIFYFLKY